MMQLNRVKLIHSIQVSFFFGGGGGEGEREGEENNVVTIEGC